MADDGIKIPVSDPRLAAALQAHFDWLAKIWPTFTAERGRIEYRRDQWCPEGDEQEYERP